MPGSLTIPKLPVVDRVVLSVAEVCALGAMSQATAYRLIHSGALPARRRGRALLVLRSDLDAYLEGLPRVSSRETVVGGDPGDEKSPVDGRF